jgi:hypothetical protein
MKTTHVGVALLAAAAMIGMTACGDSNVQADATKAGKTEAAKGFEWPWSKPKTATIPADTPLKVRTTTTLSTKTSQPGETFTATLAEPVVLEGKTVVPAGAVVEGVVASADPGGRVKGVASLSIRLTKVHVGNEEVTIGTSTVAKTARTTKKQDAAKVGIGAGVGAAIGAIAGGGRGAAIGAASGAGAGTGVVLATRGEPAVIGAESLLTFRLTAPVTVKLGN